MITNMEAWALRAQLQETLELAARGKKPTPQLIVALRGSEDALRVALHKEWNRMVSEAAAEDTALTT